MIRNHGRPRQSPWLWTRKVGLIITTFLFVSSPAMIQATGGPERPPSIIQELDLRYAGALAYFNGYEIKLPLWLPDDLGLLGMLVPGPSSVFFHYFPRGGQIPLYQGNNPGYQRPHGPAPIIYFIDFDTFIKAGGLLFGVEEASNITLRNSPREINSSSSFFGASIITWIEGNTRFSLTGIYSLN